MPPRKPTGPDRLAPYRGKRSADRTPEPFRAESAARPGLFVVHQHAARRMHYDLRLELNGVLLSWAVPKGPSLDPAEKRLAVHVEDHPLEYAEFEGRIPEGNYGAGAVIVWDRGRWEPIGDPAAGLEQGKLLFDLHGYKLRGRWTLFRTKRGPGEWLWVKKPDAWAGTGDPTNARSVHSGLTVEEVRDAVDPGQRIGKQLARLGAQRGEPALDALRPMLAETRGRAFTREGWIFELKYDGYRLLAFRDGERSGLRYRSGRDATALFPEVAVPVRALPFGRVALDGELVVLDPSGRPSFERLQQRVHLRRSPDVAQASVREPATFVVFDLLALDDFDLRGLALADRKRILREVLPPDGPLHYCDHVEERGEELFEQVERMGLEGIMAKRAASPYVAARSPDWLKIRADRVADLAIVGFSPGRGAGGGPGALHLAARSPGGLVYAGRVGSGLRARDLDRWLDELSPTRVEGPPCAGETPGEPGHVWVEPTRVCEVRFKEWTSAGHLRHPVFLRSRPDLSVAECAERPTAEAGGDDPGPVPEPAPVERVVRFTNLDKTFWPEEGYTKGDLIEYYRTVGPWLLPYLRDRPLVLTRYPDGIRGKSFYQKDAPRFAPAWVRTETIWSEGSEREIRYFVCDDAESLLYVANLGTIPLHLWSSRVAAIQRPDWCILDLDPKGAPFEHVIAVARALHDLTREIELESFVKTSGSTGLHVLIPLGGQCTYEQSRTLGHLLARLVATELPEIATIARSVSTREGRVYVDYLQNGHGRLLVAPYSVRPLPGAPVSAPLRWNEVRRGLDIGRFTIRTLPARLRRLRKDPVLPVLETRPDLGRALGLLAERVR